MRRLRSLPTVLLLAASLPCALVAQGDRGGPPTVPDSAWTALLSGGSLAGWTPKIRGEPAGSDSRGTFRVRDGVLQVRYDGYDAFEERFGHLFFYRPFSHYRLELEYRFVGEWLADTPQWARMNSGVMFHAQAPETMPEEQDFPISLEAQFLGELRPGEARPTMNLCTPGTHVVFAGSLDERHCIESTSATYPPGEWVRVELLVLGDSLVQHRVDGELVLEYRTPVVGGGVVDGFDPEVKRDGAALGTGFIALQSEGQPLDFRNVRLVELKGCTDPDSPSYRAWYVVPDPGACRHRAPRTDDVAAREIAEAVAAPEPVPVQDDWVGIGIGATRARFDGPATVDFTARRGWSVGIFADVATPLPHLAVRVEGRWTRRGGDETTGGGGAESDLLSVPLAIGPRLRLGRVSLFPFLGVEVAYPLATRRSTDIETGFENVASAEFGGLVGGSIDVPGPGGVRLGLEVRLVRGLAGSFEGRAGRLDVRAAELTLRLARPLG